jgi:hypothetical protein
MTDQPILSRLDAVVGEWRRPASVEGRPTGPARATFEWIGPAGGSTRVR